MTTEAKSSRLFQNNLLERLTHVHHNTPLFIYVPVILLALFYAKLEMEVTNLGLLAGAGIGLLNWTLFEYGLHRFVFHYEPKSAWGKRFHYLFHGIHHDFPNEKDRLVMPPAGSIPISAVVFTLHLLFFSTFGLPMVAGFLAGYLYYEFVHYSVHHKKKTGWLWKERQRRDHLTHHFKDAENRFGVTSPLWDIVFGTEKISSV